jgi:hypothetical protein
VRVHTDVGTICAVIKGSFPTADAPFDPERNSLELALRLDDSIQLCLADTVPSIVTDMNVTKLRVDNVMDLVEERPVVSGWRLANLGAAISANQRTMSTRPPEE